jgi:ATP synthase protein I
VAEGDGRQNGRQAENRVQHSGPGPASGLAFAMRLGTEFVTATLIGAGMGYGLDQWLGSTPWLLLLFLLLGVVAGFRNMYRAVQTDPVAPGKQG